MQKKDKRFLEAIYQKYFRSIWGYAYYLTSNASTADDVTQTVFTKIISHIGKLQDLPEISLKAYLNTVTRNTVYSLNRKEKNIALISLESVHKELAFAEEPSTLSEYFHSLSEMERDIIVLRYEYRLQYNEIAKILDITTNHVGVILNRINEKLRRILVGEQNEEYSQIQLKQ